MENHLEGAYNRYNIAAAVAVGRYFGIPDERIRHAIAGYVPDNNRSQRTETARNTLVIDCHNANPLSMRLAVESFLAEPLGRRQRRVLILGDMLELGEWSAHEHTEIIRQAAQSPDAELLLVGSEFTQACASLPEKPARTTLCPTREELLSRLRLSPSKTPSLLLKGSRGIGLEKAIPEL